MESFVSHWKTTANGILQFLITTLTVLTGFYGTGDLINTKEVSIYSLHTHTWIPAGMTIALALCRAWVGVLQQDAGTQNARISGEDAVKAVPSHELPDNPEAVAVVKE